MFSQTKSKAIFEKAMSAYLAWDNTEEEWKKVLSLFDEAAKDPELTLPALLMKYSLLDDPDEEEEVIERLFRNFPQSVGVLLAIWRYYLLNEKEIEARRILQKAKKQPLFSAWDALILGRFYVDYENNKKKAMQAYTQGIAMDPTIPWLYIYRTECQTDEKKVIEDLTKAIELLPEEESLYEMRAGFYDLVGEIQKAVQDYEWLLQRRPDDPEILYLLGSCLLDLDEREKGRAYLERVIQLDPEGEMGEGAQELLDELDEGK
ncbi:hypothetical protein BREVNS_2402 [Brevinematales bacterium NS]|jgi:tetratricopeptide (TPR) repeat protein|nr:hypothetical protein [Brevinematales bacterium]QJR23152.1 hypothetical protein BREVNS_2402 [Brevinematales bacterium NS]